MARFLDRFRKRADPTDDEIADLMRSLAEGFRSGSAAEGVPFSWESTEASRLVLLRRFVVSRAMRNLRGV
jgi:hypothetical protein